MERRSVSEAFLKYLICKHPNDAAEVHQKRMFRMGLIPPEIATIEFVREELEVPVGFRPSKGHSSSVSFLRRQGIYGLFFPDKDDVGAAELLQRPKVKIAAEAWMLTGAPIQGVRLFLENNYKFLISDKSIEKYTEYYFNYHLLAAPYEHVQMLRLYHQEYNPSERLESLKLDPRWFAAIMPKNETGRRLVRLRLGLPTQPGDSITAFKQVRDYIGLHVAGAMAGAGANSYDILRLIQAGQMAHQIVETADSPTEDILKAHQRVSLKQANTSIVMLGQLSKGKHNTSTIFEGASSHSEEPIDVEFELAEEASE